MIPFILKTSSISMFPIGAAPVTIDAEHMNFGAVRDAILEKRFDDALAMASVKSFVNHITAGAVQVGEDGVSFNGVPINSYLANKMTQFFTEGLDITHYCRFLENLMANPSMTSREELYLFLEAADLPITEDGCFVAYKAVTSDFKDKHTRTFDNSPGAVLSMPRREVDDNRSRTCSYGYHAAAYTYAKNFLGGGGDRMVAVKINPADVVSVPSDHNNQKLRTCKYEVLHEIPDAFDTLTGRAFYSTAIVTDDGFDEPEEMSDYDTGFEDGFNNVSVVFGKSLEYYRGYADGQDAS